MNVVPEHAMKACMRSGGTAPLILNPLNTELNPICHLLALLGAHLIFHVSRVRVNVGTK
jgi:transposase